MGMAQTSPTPIAPAASTGPKASASTSREKTGTYPHRLADTRINAPSFADYFDEYARMAVGIVGLGTLTLGLLLWGAF